MGSAIICFVLSVLSLVGVVLAIDANPLLATTWITACLGSAIIWFLGGMAFLWFQRLHNAIDELKEASYEIAQTLGIHLQAIDRNGQLLNIRMGAVAPPTPVPQPDDRPAWLKQPTNDQPQFNPAIHRR